MFVNREFMCIEQICELKSLFTDELPCENGYLQFKGNLTHLKKQDHARNEAWKIVHVTILTIFMWK